MKLKCLIVDDDSLFISELKDILSDYLTKIFFKYSIETINHDFYKIDYNQYYDLIFLDIDLKDKNGINVAKIVRETNPEYNELIVFISARNDLVFDSLSVHPFHFVRKSHLEKDMKILFKLLTDYFKNTLRLITFNYYGRKTSIFQKDILYIESYGHNLAIVTKDKQYEYRSTMKEGLELIGTSFIVQIQRSLAIPISQIDMVEKSIVYMKNGKSYKIGKKYKEPLLQKYQEYLLQ